MSEPNILSPMNQKPEFDLHAGIRKLAEAEWESNMRLSSVLKEYRWATHADVRTMAKEIGVSASTLSRIEHGESPSGESLVKILQWLFAEEEQHAKP